MLHQRLFHNFLLDLLDDLVDPQFDFLFLLLVMLGMLTCLLPLLLAHFCEVIPAKGAPCVPLIHEPLAERDELRGSLTFLQLVLLVEPASVFAEILADLLLLLFGEECARARAPEELLEAIEDVLLDLFTSEAPNSVPVFKLELFRSAVFGYMQIYAYSVSPCAGTGGKVATARIPLHICDTIVVCRAELLDAGAPFALLALLELISVEVKVPEFKLGFARRSHGGEDYMTTFW
jgi:hypothetical protein